MPEKQDNHLVLFITQGLRDSRYSLNMEWMTKWKNSRQSHTERNKQEERWDFESDCRTLRGILFFSENEWSPFSHLVDQKSKCPILWESGKEERGLSSVDVHEISVPRGMMNKRPGKVLNSDPTFPSGKKFAEANSQQSALMLQSKDTPPSKQLLS